MYRNTDMDHSSSLYFNIVWVKLDTGKKVRSSYWPSLWIEVMFTKCDSCECENGEFVRIEMTIEAI